MGIVKRLLNVGAVFALLALVLACFGWARGYTDYIGKLSEQRIACEKQIEFDRKVAERVALPPEQREPFFQPDVSYRYLCEREVESQIFVYGKSDLGISVVIFFAIAVLNYIFFGKVKVWNRE
jgi:hypothetical protein